LIVTDLRIWEGYYSFPYIDNLQALVDCVEA
jgi:hypothetical protein